ncbi:hypothetical protein SRS16P3_00199 (plasmid) [Variovorax sp. SRS16]|uniref:DUF4189 domain-containing protein n=1 Tax=Variovorax sp. SRS16 TaxID=282217 RepID=UPI001316B88C|nr:DUF4189 domain-containing protein [Variovorax sp. SRS16]VTU46487.1 hypothetical protein SRS16P3_00199 [Variovorax sp. SRS16]
MPLIDRSLFAALLLCGALAGIAADPAHADPGPSWGAIASRDAGGYGYSFNHPSRAAAELAARAQCDRAAGRPGTCAIRAYFDRSCGALATGNYGEWGTAIASTAAAAGKAAAVQCDSHLPTQPCKVVVSICSPR